MRTGLRWLFILALTVGLQACTSRDDDGSSSESRLNKATELIDKGDYDQAIVELEDLKKSEPSEKVRLVLASAYAGRAGIKVENYWGFVVTYKPLLKGGAEESESEASFLDVRALPKSAPKEVREFLISLNDNMREFMRIRRRVERIPHASRQARFDLQKGVDVLEGVSTQGGHLYRAILEVILLRSAIDEAVDLASALLDDPGATVCTSKARRLVDWAGYSQGTLSNALSDLIGAYPDDRDELQGIRKSVDSFEIPSMEQVCASRP